MTALEKIFVILDEQGDEKLERLFRTLSSLFSYTNLTSNLFLVTGNLPKSMPQVKRIQEDVSAFLRANLFSRLYVHFVHPVSPVSLDEIRLCYQYLKGATREFDREGYMHQEVPRLMLLPVAIPESQIDLNSFEDLLDGLKGSFLLPSLLVEKSTSFITQDKTLLAKVEKVYYGHDTTKKPTEILCNLCRQDILDDSCARLESEKICMTDPCPAALIVSGQDGMVYSCMDTFLNKESLANIYEKHRVDFIIDRYNEYSKSKRDCLECRDRVVGSFSGLPLPKAATHKVGALLYHFGTLRQGRDDHVRAIADYERSLKVSPIEEANAIYFRLGVSYTKTGHYDQAIEAFSKAEGTYDDQYYLHFYAGLCYFEKGDSRMAIEKFSNALHLKPQQEDLITILLYIGTCHNSLGEYESACLHLERAKAMAASVKEIYSALGFSYFQLKDYDRAIENLSRAVKIDSHSAIDYASLGANYRDKGDINRAIAMYEKALALDPGLTAAQENIERLTKGKP